jgi:hypothetical protein
MIVFLVLVVLAVFVLIGSTFVLGFRLGGDHWQSELAKVRLQAAQAERQLHNLTRQAFITMAEAVEQRRHER